LDNGVPVEDLESEMLEMLSTESPVYPDYFIFELSKHMSRTDIAKKLHKTVNEIDDIITRYIGLASELLPFKEDLDNKFAQLKNDFKNIG